MLLAKVTFNPYIVVQHKSFLISMPMKPKLVYYFMLTYIFINQGLITYFNVNYYYKIYKFIQNSLERITKVYNLFKLFINTIKSGTLCK